MAVSQLRDNEVASLTFFLMETVTRTGIDHERHLWNTTRLIVPQSLLIYIQSNVAYINVFGTCFLRVQDLYKYLRRITADPPYH